MYLHIKSFINSKGCASIHDYRYFPRLKELYLAFITSFLFLNLFFVNTRDFEISGDANLISLLLYMCKPGQMSVAILDCCM